MNIKDRVKELLVEMSSDSKSASYKAEKELCKILSDVIKKMHAVEKTLGQYIRDYPYDDKITEIEYYSEMCNYFPKEFYCNEEEFVFNTAWLDWTDEDFKNYFEDLKRKEIGGIRHTIERVEYSLEQHRNRISRLETLNFSDVNYE
jgi:hypothetical protein